MADPAHDHRSPHTQLTSRRVSFRMSIADAALPLEYLEQLEQKRKQLDESIHKYIASKEREYKNFEKELKSQLRFGSATQHNETAGAVLFNGPGSASEAKRRTSSESTTMSVLDDSGTHTLSNQTRLSLSVEALLRDGTHIEPDAIEDEVSPSDSRTEIAGLADRRASVDRDKEFVGLFTPQYLCALDGRTSAQHLDRVESAPAIVAISGESPTATLQVPREVARANSDSVVAKAKRPSQLQENSRASSSGSSADGRLALASALKSPIQKDRPKRKRVSLAVGDTIVAPSDNVPLTMTSNNHPPSHSRVRPPNASRKDPAPNISAEAMNPNTQSTGISSPLCEQILGTSPSKNPGLQSSILTSHHLELSTLANTLKNGLSPSLPLSNKNSKIDADGDLFDLEEDSDGELVNLQAEKHLDSDEFDQDEADFDDPVTIRDEADEIYDIDGHKDGSLQPDEHYSYSSTSGLIAAPGSSPERGDTATTDEVELEFRPGSSYSSRQPTQPGFRRPSVSMDPVFRGSGYARVEAQAAKEGVYGSKYEPAEIRNSLVGGGASSLGESFMERNATELMRQRVKERQAAPERGTRHKEVRS
ncbi:Hypothetical protein R9X50_00654000 [Acrodontium crateriforme]|uniref:Uncharacterized protein n=1 Tax=Acrodontium crateriforme TaxID=150365 RepID=A0AAQ3M821_9PEZI|nr:Hypothetical protein R9X50_00654000 [Acrodontium crateriforme]